MGPVARRNIKTDRRGLQYTFAQKGLHEDPRFMQWVDGVAKNAQATALLRSGGYPQ
jgi:hypothetical protein